MGPGSPNSMTASAKADENEIRRLQQDWMDAWLRQDRATIEQILAPDYTLTVSSLPSQAVTRDRWIELVERFTAESFEYRDMSVRLIGDVAVVSSIGRAVGGQVDGSDRSFPFFLTDVWVKRDGRWRVAARYSSIPETGTESSKSFESSR